MAVDRVQAMRVFVAVLEQKSLSNAALTLGVSLPTVSRVLTSLERDLGVRLIARSTRGLLETDGGRVYFQRCREILDAIRSAETAVQTHCSAPSGELRISAPGTFGRHHISPALTRFMEMHAGISCYLSLSDHLVSLKEQHFDLAIRVATLKDENLAARRLGFIQNIVVGGRSYLARRGVPRAPCDLKQHDCIHFLHCSRGNEWTFAGDGRQSTVRIDGRFRADDQEAVLASVLAGGGLALLPAWLVHSHIEAGSLEQVLENFTPPRTPVHAVFPAAGAPPGKVRALVEFLHERFRSCGLLTADGASTTRSPRELEAGS